MIKGISKGFTVLKFLFQKKPKSLFTDVGNGEEGKCAFGFKEYVRKTAESGNSALKHF